MIYLISAQRRLYTDFIMSSTWADLSCFVADKEVLGLDTETSGYDPYICELLLIQIGNHENQFVIDWKAAPNIEELDKILHSGCTWLLHNAAFDYRFIYHLGLNIPKIYDTFLAEALLTAGYENPELSLLHLGMKYCDIELDKSIRGVINREGLTDRVISYAANDVKYLEDIKNAQAPYIKQWNLENVLNLENEAVKVFARMQYNGMPFNPAKWTEVAVETSAMAKESINQLDEVIWKERTKYPKLLQFCKLYRQQDLFDPEVFYRKTHINWNSPAQKLKILNFLNISVTSVADKELQQNKLRHELIPLLIGYSKTAKLVSSFGYKFLQFIHPVTKRIHSSIWQILATGRISMSEPNMQQIPSHGTLANKIRASFVAPSGYKIVSGDYSGMELRIIAEFSQDPVWLKVFRDGGDLHSELCALTFNIPLSDVKSSFPPKPDLKYRDVQKTIDFMLAYGGSEYKLSSVMQISIKEAKKIIDKFFSLVPKVQSFLSDLGNAGRNRGYIRTPHPFTRIRWFPDWEIINHRNPSAKDYSLLGSIERESKNMPIQSTNANITKQALIYLQEEIDLNNYPVEILITIHDEILTLCKEEFAEPWKDILEEIMIKAAQLVIKTIPVVVDCKINNFWEK